MERLERITLILLLTFHTFFEATAESFSETQIHNGEDFYAKQILRKHDSNQDGVLTFEELDAVFKRMKLGPQMTVEAESKDDFAKSNSSTSVCLDTAALLRDHGLNNTTTVNATLLAKLLPAMVYSAGRGNCDRTNTTESLHTKPTQAEVWGYALAFVTLINILSNIGAFLVPIMHTAYYQLVLMFMVALAVGCMTGTSLFVLMPEAYDLMNIQETSGDYLWKAGTVVLVIYFFFLLERIMYLITKLKREQKRKIDAALETTLDIASPDYESKLLPEGLNGVSKRQKHDHSHGTSDPNGDKPKVATVAWMVLAGDGIHNLLDGLAIGAGFTESVLLGLSISIAVICEEIPHELGDIAILMHSGLKPKRALFYNFLAAMTCYVGVIIGIVLGENLDVNKWVYASASGMFLYVSLVDMLPEVNRTGDSLECQALGPIKVCVIQNLGLLIGLGIIYAMANFTGSIVL